MMCKCVLSETTKNTVSPTTSKPLVSLLLILLATKMFLRLIRRQSVQCVSRRGQKHKPASRGWSFHVTSPKTRKYTPKLQKFSFLVKLHDANDVEEASL